MIQIDQQLVDSEISASSQQTSRCVLDLDSFLESKQVTPNVIFEIIF